MSAAAPAQEPLAIIGVGCLFPGAKDFGAYWARVKGGHDAITDVPPTHWRAEDYLHPDPKAPDRVYAARGGFLEAVPFNPAAFGIAPNSLEATDTAQLLGLVAAQQALADAGYAAGKIDRGRVSVILGVTGTLELVIPLGARLGHPIWRRALREAGVDDTLAEDVVQRIGESYVGWQESSFPGLLGNVVAGRIANRFDLGGTNCVVDAACASSLSAIHLAAMELQTGRADLVVTGGIDTFNDIFMYMCFSKTPALSPAGDARPFDAAADGTTLGEGLGLVVLKRLADARRDGDRVYAVLRGMGSSSDGKGNAIYAPRAAGQVEALKRAYQNANVGPETVELVEAHGTGTKVGDATEVEALTEVYRAGGRDGTWCALGSVKSQIGHTKAAAGAAGLIKAAAALYHKVLPPTIKVERPIEGLQPGRSPFYVNTEKRPWLPSPGHPRRAGVSAFGFGGSNFHCVLEEADGAKPGIDWDGDVQVLAFAADAPAGLREQLAAWRADRPWDELRAAAASSRAAWRADAPCRLLLAVQRDRTDLPRLLASARTLLDKQAGKSSWHSPDGVYYGSGAPAGTLAALFSGQGAQYPGMLRALACQFPALHETLAEADRAGDGPRLSDSIYPHPPLTPEARAEAETALRATDVAQPALGAVSLGAWRILAEDFGVRAAAVAGHSYGELTALCAAGRIDPPSFHALSRLRGRLMAARPEGAEAGTMLAVQAPQETILEVLRAEGIDLVLANKNAPQQTVLSGPTAAVERAAAAFAARKIRATRLAVAGAFHTPLVAGAAAPFRAALEEVQFHAGRVPVFANSTADAYPADAGSARDLLAQQLARPVEFVAEVEALYRAGVRTFLEVGPGSRLTGLVGAILQGREHEALALDASAGQRSGTFDLACCLARLAVLGHEVRLSAWDGGAPRQAAPADNGKPALLVPLCGANYVKPKPSRPPAPARPKAQESHPVPNGTTPPMNGPSSPRESAPPADDSALAQALQLTRESMAALQRMQEQSAQLHRQFLEGQESAQRTVQTLVEQQQRLLQISLGLAPAPMLPPAPVPVALSQPAPLPPPPPAPAPVSQVVAPVPAQAVTVPPAPAPVAAPPKATSAAVEKVLVEVVSEKTGYPAEMLDLDMALDADLGIDSIKRVEILSALQERLPEAPAIKPEHLGTLHTLRHIAAFLAGASESQPHQPQAPARGPSVPTPALGAGTQAAVEKVLVEVVSEKTGYPAEMLDLDMALDADLGIDSIKRVE
ncbi:MAG TPA: beta-ketoacyl synthase N-terminal-like domain-containing protein, partial [Gemmataceae bacterium]|nr:beta-ketoacyl synthase N-terminal-like domain-containing protein [Gemmataceae bacterium]